MLAGNFLNQIESVQETWEYAEGGNAPHQPKITRKSFLAIKGKCKHHFQVIFLKQDSQILNNLFNNMASHLISCKFAIKSL